MQDWVLKILRKIWYIRGDGSEAIPARHKLCNMIVYCKVLTHDLKAGDYSL